MKLAIVILNYNGKALLERFLPSVIAFSKDASIYIADNGSDDNSAAFIKRKFPQIKILEFSKNYGYAKGYNKAVKKIEADVFCFLNSDVRVTKNWLLPVIQAFERNKNTGIIQPKILDEKNPEKFEYAGAAGGFIDQLGYPYCRGRIFETIEEDKAQYDGTAPIFWASGACFFIRSILFKQLNGFDGNFFAHMEEIDLCWRAKNQKHSILYVSNSTVFHLGGASLKPGQKKTFLNFRNSLLTLTKNSKHPLVLVVLLRLILDGFAAVKFFLDGKFQLILAIIKAHFSYYKLLPYALSYRKAHKRLKYSGVKSIVFKYYVLKIKTFKKLNRQ